MTQTDLLLEAQKNLSDNTDLYYRYEAIGRRNKRQLHNVYINFLAIHFIDYMTEDDLYVAKDIVMKTRI